MSRWLVCNVTVGLIVGVIFAVSAPDVPFAWVFVAAVGLAAVVYAAITLDDIRDELRALNRDRGV